MRWAAAAVALALLAGGCGEDAAAHQGRDPAAAGRLCPLLAFDAVASSLGVRFDTAAGGRQDATLTCAVTQSGHDYPYLTIAATGSDADQVIFVATVVPSGAELVNGLGLAAYRLRVPPTDGAGPAIELGWLSRSRRLMAMKYVFPSGTPDADVGALVPKLIDFAARTDETLSNADPLTFG